MADNIEIDESDEDGDQSRLQSLREELAVETKKKKAEQVYKQLKDSISCTSDDITIELHLTEPKTRKQMCDVLITLQQRAKTHEAHINQINYEKGRCKDYIKFLEGKVGFDYSRSYCEFLIRFHKTCLVFERLGFSSSWIKD